MEDTQQCMISLQSLSNWLVEKGADWSFRLLGAIIILAIGAIVIRIFSKILQKSIEGRVGDREMLVRFLVSVIVKSSWAVLFVLVLDKLGVQVGPLIAGLGVTGFVLGFAFQESLGSLAAGMMLAFNRPFKTGDFVSVDGHEGKVVHLDMMAVVLVTGDGKRITIPNKQAWGAAIINYSAQGTRRVEVVVNIAYGADISKARELACDTLKGIPLVLQDPAPMAAVKSLGDSAVVLVCRAWVKSSDYWPTLFAANQKVQEVFAGSGIKIPYPQLDVHVSQS